jgi:tetraacyldisaccharide 4'-kinase
VAGGAGKTPTAIAVAKLLRQIGESPVFLSRGHGRTTRGALIVDLARHRASDVGDEPLLLARHAATVVAADRVVGARLAAPLGSVIIMDDGLQNPSLAKDFSLAVVDGETGVGNGFCIPAGPLRAPAASQLARIDAVLVIGAGAAGERVAAEASRRGCAVMTAQLVPDPAGAAALAGQRVFAFAGIGRPAKFFATLKACGAQVVASQSFDDHYAYCRADIDAILLAAQADALQPVTTEKDDVRLRPLLDATARAAIQTLPVRLMPAEPERLHALIANALAKARSHRAEAGA